MSYTVQRGDTLSAIARRNGVPLSELLAANPQIKNPNRIFIGQAVNLPGNNPDPSADLPGNSPAPQVSEDQLVSLPDGTKAYKPGEIAPTDRPPDQGSIPGAADPLADPAFAAFLRQLQLSESLLRGNAQINRERILADQRVNAPQFDVQRAAVERNQNNAFENRGLFRSGLRLDEIARGQAQIDRNELSSSRAADRALVDIERNVARQLAANRLKQSENEITTRAKLEAQSG